ncbi:hypothetical protein [Microbacterium soli]|uniref:Uncharacterized protein n=1 Tax=Microbacterium soli TaxID=446075 RepID=A0ABP7MWG0_9MICO
MISGADADRLRELQRRAFAPGGGLTAEEAEELRMLTAPRSEDASAPAPEHSPEENPQEGRPSEGRPSEGRPPEQPAQPGIRRRSRLLIPLVAVVALVLGLGIARLVFSPEAPAGPPEMTAAQQQLQGELDAQGDFDPGSLAFAGEKQGAAVWTAARDGDRCVVMVVGEEHGIQCDDPERGSFGNGIIATQVERATDDAVTYYTAYLARVVSGEWAVMLERWDMGPETAWIHQYSDQERALLRVLEDEGFGLRNLSIVGYDGDLPVFVSTGDEQCVAVVDPDTLVADRSCSPSREGTTLAEGTVELGHGHSLYSVTWTRWRGPILTITELTKRANVVGCDAPTGACTAIDDRTGDIG